MGCVPQRALSFYTPPMRARGLTIETLVAAGTAGALWACGPSDAGSTGDVDAGPEERSDARSYPDAGRCEDSVDVVFVLDVSSSMGFVLNDLEENIGSVVEAAGELADDPHFGLIAFADNYKLDDGGTMGGGHIHTDAATLVDAFATYRSVYTNADRNPGDGPDGPTLQNPICEENANDALHAAATEFPWRERASRVVIVATDDTFLERPDNYGDRDGDGDTNSPGFPTEGDYPALRTLDETTTALGDADVRVFSFTRLDPPGLLAPGRCGTGRRLPWESVSDGWSTPYDGAAPLPEATDGRNYDLDAVRGGDLSLSETINEVVLESHCNSVD